MKTRSQRDKVGELRPSQLLFTFGVGATVELPYLSVLVMGTDDWNPAYSEELHEPRLLQAVQKLLGVGVRRILTPPRTDDSGTLPGTLDSADRIGVPVAAFPRWARCPRCEALAPLRSGLFQLKTNPHRPDRAQYVHSNCQKVQKAPPPVLPARFLVACPSGHLDDFPWHEYLHDGGPCSGQLRLKELGPSGTLSALLLTCDCGKTKSMAQAFDPELKDRLGTCRGRRPHLRDFQENGCKQPVRPIMLGASNSWFPLRLSGLSIPASVNPIEQLVTKYWTHLGECESARDVKFARKGCPGLEPYSDEEIWQALAAVRDAGDSDEVPDPELKLPEWEVFSRPDPSRNSEDFRLKEVPVPQAYQPYLERVVLAERLREVHALLGFTRLESPEEFGSLADVPKDRWMPLCRTAPAWVPGAEVRGEGLFLQFREDAILAWAAGTAVMDRENDLFAAHQAWRRVRNIDYPDRGFPGSRYALLHSFSHALMRQLCLECGYMGSSVRERIYSRDPNDEGGPMAGVLIYTAAPDSEGTLGGLVGLGMPEVLGRHLDLALEGMRLCASDPLCAEHLPAVHGLDLHGACCHACLFAPETSCERGNRYLDRNMLVASIATDQAAFFRLEDGGAPLSAQAPPTAEAAFHLDVAPLDISKATGIPVVDLAKWSASGPQPVGFVDPGLAGVEAAEGVFIASVEGEDLNKLFPPGARCLFRRLTDGDPLPDPDALVIVRDPRLHGPILGAATVRRLYWSVVVDAENAPRFTRVLLKPRSSDLRIPTQTLEIPAPEWEAWRPYACFVGLFDPPRR